MLIISTKKSIIIHNFNVYEKIMIQFNEFNKINYIIFFLKIRIKFKLKKLDDQLDIFGLK